MKKLILIFGMLLLMIGIVNAQTCSDSDGGKDYYERGCLSYGEFYNCDYCWDGHMREYYCSDNKGYFIDIAIPSGYKCASGILIKGVQCEDSDYGLDYYVKGTVSEGGYPVATDKCTSSRELIEYYCGTYGLDSGIYLCPSGYECKDGACVEEEIVRCSDSDGGKDYNKKGIVSEGGVPVATDKCTSSRELIEYFCGDYGLDSDIYNCLSGYECKDGACIKQGDICNEGWIGNPQCSGNNVIQTWQDSDCNSYSKTKEDCQTKGMVCENGACVLPSECTTGETKIHTCHDGEIIVTHKCINKNWASTGKECPSEESKWWVWALLIGGILIALGAFSYALYYIIKKM